MVPPVVVVDPGRTAALDAQDHQRLIKQPLGLEVGEEGAHRLVHDCRLPCGPLEAVRVRVPAALAPRPSQQTDERLLVVSRPSLSLMRGVRPNSVPRTPRTSPAFDTTAGQQAREGFVVVPPAGSTTPAWLRA